MSILNYIEKMKEMYEGERITAQGPRNMYQDGQLVRNTVDGSRPGYNGAQTITTRSIGNGIYENTSEATGKKTWYGKIQRNKKLLKSPHGTKEDAIKFVTEKRKIHPSKSVIVLQSEQGTLLEQPKYKKALTNALDDLAKMETKGYGAINEIVKKYQNMFSRVGEKTVQGKIIEKGITTESRAITNAIRSYAAENNIRDVQIKEMEKALDGYLAKKIPERGYIPKLMKKHGIPEATFNSWLIELNARRKIPLKYKNESEKIKAVRAKRDAALKKYSSPGFERWTKGTAESGLQGGHTGQIYSEDVTPKTKKFTPAKINQETLKKYDAILQGIADKRDKAFKAKNWAEVERLNQKGMNVASATEGYKTFTIKNRDGTKFEWGSTTKGAIDPMDLTKEGITAKEMESWRMGKNPIMTKAKKDFKNKIISKAELETINAAEEAKLFAEGKNKALLDFQKSEAMQSAKMSKKEITALDKRLRENLIKLCPKGKASGGRIGFANAGSAVSTLECGRRTATKLLGSGTANTEQKQILKEILRLGSGLMRGVGKALSPKDFFKLRNWIGPGAWATLGAFEAGEIGYDTINNNTPLNEALGDNWVTGWAMPWTKKEAQIKNLGEANISGSPAMQKYMEQVKLMAEYERGERDLKNLKMGTASSVFGVESFRKTDPKVIEAQQAKLDKINNDWVNLQETAMVERDGEMVPVTGGEIEFQKAVSDMEGERQAGYYEPDISEGVPRDLNEYGYRDVGDETFFKKILPDSWVEQGTPIKKDPKIVRTDLPPQLSTSGYHKMPKYDVDLTKYEKQPGVAEATTTPLNAGELEGIEQYWKDVGYKHPRFGKISEDEIRRIQTREKWRQLFEQSPTGLHGAKFADGGRAGYMGGGIAAIRKPHAIPPERQGLRSIMINGKKS